MHGLWHSHTCCPWLDHSIPHVLWILSVCDMLKSHRCFSACMQWSLVWPTGNWLLPKVGTDFPTEWLMLVPCGHLKHQHKSLHLPFVLALSLSNVRRSKGNRMDVYLEPLGAQVARLTQYHWVSLLEMKGRLTLRLLGKTKQNTRFK